MNKPDYPNYTMVPNIFFDEHLKQLKGSEVVVYLTVIRKTLGFVDQFGNRKTRDKISYSQIREMTGLGTQAIAAALKKLEEYGLIESIKAHRKTSEYIMVFDPESTLKIKDNENLGFENQRQTTLKIKDKKAESTLKIKETKESNINKERNILSPIGENKRNEQEHTLFKEIWDAFEKGYGKIEKKFGGREANAIWEMIDMAKEKNPDTWSDFLKTVVTEYARMKQAKRPDEKYFWDHPFKPSMLCSGGIWSHVLNRMSTYFEPTSEELAGEVPYKGDIF